jgi:SSS family solute:Na+ symporter
MLVCCWLFEVGVILVTFASVWMAQSRQDIFELVGESSAFSLVSLFVPLTFGLYWKRANAIGCLASMILGLGVLVTLRFCLENSFPCLALWYRSKFARNDFRVFVNQKKVD